MKIELDMYQTLALAVLVLMLGKFLRERVRLLDKFCIPAPVMGGIMILLFGAIMVVGLNTLVRAGQDLLRPRNMVIVALIINASSYVAEIIRAGIQAVDKGQTEAARSLGLTAGHTMSKVVLPQAVKNILPALGNEFINMIKQVSLASVFFINELTTSYRTVLAATYRPIEAIVIAGMIYLLVTTVLSQIVELAEWRMRKNERC